MPTWRKLRSSPLFWLSAGAFVYAWLLTQGLPLWDDDFTSWFAKIQGRGFFSLLGEWLWPVSTQPQYWGFNERPLQKLIFKCLQAVFGYHGWGYYLFKDLAFAGVVSLVYAWGLRLVPQTREGRLAACAAAGVFALAPGPGAALVIYSDYAPVAELIFLALTYGMWRDIEATPASWRGLPDLKDPAQRRWLLRWSGWAVLAYLGYKSKADLKLIPVILGGYLLVVRRRQLGFFALPLALMALLAVPWGGAAFERLPGFLPGSQGSEVNWMWQPPSFSRLAEFFWSSQGYSLVTTLTAPTLSLGAVLGPFLLLPLVGFLLWRMEAFDRVPWRRLDRAEDRARLFVLLWLGCVVAAISSLAAINYSFRIRYGILPMVPLSLLLAWCFGRVAESWYARAGGARDDGARLLPRWAALGLVGLGAIQCLLNAERSLRYRHEMGQVMVAVDDVYNEVAEHHAGDRLALLPDFRPYDYHPDAPALFRDKLWLGDGIELVKKKYPEGATSVISWKPSLWDRLEVTGYFSGCSRWVLADRLFPCARGTGAWLMRFIAADPDYAKGEDLRAKGDLAGALKLHEAFLARHPHSPAAQFVIGIEALGLNNYARADQAYEWLERGLPDHLSILYNHALALEGLGRFPEAIERLDFIVEREPRNYAALIHLYWDVRKSGMQKREHELGIVLKQLFPADPEVQKL